MTVFGPMTEARPVEKAKATGAGASSSRLPSPPDHAPPAVPVPAVPPPPPHRPKPEGLTPKAAPPSKPPGLRLESSDVPTSSSVPSASNPLAAVEAALGDLDPVVSLVVCLDSGLGGRTKSINPEPKEYWFNNKIGLESWSWDDGMMWLKWNYIRQLRLLPWLDELMRAGWS